MLGRQHFIFNQLINKRETYTAEQLAKLTRVSIRTIKSDMESVKMHCKDNGVELCSKSGIGYWIEIKDKEVFSDILFQSRIRGSLESSKLNHDEDYPLFLKTLISLDRFTHLDKLERQLSISRSRLSVLIKNSRELLELYDLKILSSSQNGIFVEGLELSKRIFMLRLFDTHHHLLKNHFSISAFDKFFESDTDEISDMRKLLLQTLVKYKLRLADINTQQIARYLVLQRKRVFYGHKLEEIKSRSSLKKFSLIQTFAADILKQANVLYPQTINHNDQDALVYLILNRIDISSYDDLRNFYEPMLDEVTQVTKDYIEYFYKLAPFVMYDSKAMIEDLSIAIAPVYLSVFLKQELYYSKTKLKVTSYQSPFAFIMATNIKKYFKINFSQSINTSNFEKLVVRLTLHFYFFQSRNHFSIRALACSSASIAMAKLITRDLLNTSRNNYYEELRPIELYEGRYIDKDDYDIFILHELDEIFYDYDWPLYTVSNENYKEDIKNITIRVKEVNDLKIVREIANKINVRMDFRHVSEISEELLCMQKFRNNNIIMFDNNLEENNFHVTHYNDKDDSKNIVVINYNYNINSFDALYKLELIMNDFCN
ncbi:MAG: HTH domain-containing protein [Erysipelothrix sp.]|nr:HTH domain-containing protein [Erysipelothrix sp.]